MLKLRNVAPDEMQATCVVHMCANVILWHAVGQQVESIYSLLGAECLKVVKLPVPG